MTSNNTETGRPEDDEPTDAPTENEDSGEPAIEVDANDDGDDAADAEDLAAYEQLLADLGAVREHDTVIDFMPVEELRKGTRDA